MAALGYDFGRVLALMTRGEVHRRSTVARITQEQPEIRQQMSPRTLIGADRLLDRHHHRPQDRSPPRRCAWSRHRLGGGLLTDEKGASASSCDTSLRDAFDGHDDEPPSGGLGQATGGCTDGHSDPRPLPAPRRNHHYHGQELPTQEPRRGSKTSQSAHRVQEKWKSFKTSQSAHRVGSRTRRSEDEEQVS